MATCGNCKATGQTVEHIKACYANRYTQTKTVEVTGFAKAYVEKKHEFVRPDLSNLPDSKYAILWGGELVFLDGAKIAAGAGTLAGGVVFALGGSEGTAAVTAPVMSAVQDMFVGKPEF